MCGSWPARSSRADVRLDAHHHLWRFDTREYGWIADDATALRRDYLHADLIAELDGAGLDGAIAVQARSHEHENAFLLEQADAASTRIRGVVGWVDLADRAVDDSLARWAAHPRFVGVRHVVQAEPDSAFLTGTAFNHGVSRLRHHGLVYDLLVYGRQLPAALAFVDRHPEQAFVLDHIAKPRIVPGQFDATWARDLRSLAARPHVVCKLSGVVTEAPADWTEALIRPYLDLAVEVFGPGRLLFGSDWPVCRLGIEYAAWVELLRRYSASWSTDEQAAFWGGTAARVYGVS